MENLYRKWTETEPNLKKKLWPDSGIELRTYNAIGESYPTTPAGNWLEVI